MQLLKITTTPVKYEIEVEHARLEYNQKSAPDPDFTIKKPEMDVKTEFGQMKMSTYKARQSFGMYTVKDTNAMLSSKAEDNLKEYIDNTVQTGKQLSQIDDGITIGQIVKQRMLEQPELYTAFIPASGVEMSWEPSSLDIQFSAGKADTDFKIDERKTEYIPGSVHLRILENTDVQIEYIGGPVYFPKSMDPKYR